MSKLSTSASITTIYSSKDLISHYTQKLKPFTQRLGEELFCKIILVSPKIGWYFHPSQMTDRYLVHTSVLFYKEGVGGQG
jgi:hypothetical protein